MFSWKFSKVFGAAISKYRHESSAMEYSRVLGCRPLSYFLIKKRLYQRQFLQNFGDHIILRKSLRLIPILVATYNISKNTHVH